MVHSTRKKGWLATAAVLGASALALTACSAGGSGDAPADGPVTLSFWGWAPGLEDAVADWNSANPDVQIDFYRMTGDDGDKIPAAIDAGTAPDIVQLDNHAVPGYVINNRLTDITEFAGDLESQFTPASWATVQLNDAVYGVPEDSGPTGLMYRTDIFDQYGLTVPTTWDEYLDTARALKAANPSAYIAQFSPNETGFWMEQVLQNEGSWYGIDGDAWTVGVDDEKSQEVAAIWQSLLDEDLVKVVDMWTPEYWAEVNAGTIATINYAAWFPALLEESAASTSGLWAVAPTPTFDGLDTAGQAGGSVGVIPAGTENVAQAVDFLTWLSAGDGLDYILDAGIFPAAIAGLDSEALLQPEEFFGGQVINEVFADAATRVPGTWVDGPTFELTQQALKDEFAKVANGQLTFAEALANVQAKTVKDITAMGLNVAS